MASLPSPSARAVIARERSDDAIQTKRPGQPSVWMASSLRSLAMTVVCLALVSVFPATPPSRRQAAAPLLRIRYGPFGMTASRRRGVLHPVSFCCAIAAVGRIAQQKDTVANSRRRAERSRRAKRPRSGRLDGEHGDGIAALAERPRRHREGASARTNASHSPCEAIQTKRRRYPPVWIASSLRSLAMTAGAPAERISRIQHRITAPPHCAAATPRGFSASAATSIAQ